MEPSDRLTCTDLKKHEYFDGFRDQFEAELQVSHFKNPFVVLYIENIKRRKENIRRLVLSLVIHYLYHEFLLFSRHEKQYIQYTYNCIVGRQKLEYEIKSF